jgi:hypothetical protein
MTCRCASSVRPAPEADKQRFRWVQLDKQLLSRVEPSVAGRIGLTFGVVLSRDRTCCFSAVPMVIGGRVKREG